jgi:hypothetical protein
VLELHLHDPRANGSPQRRVIPLGLVGISKRKFAHRLVELGVLPEVPADRPGVSLPVRLEYISSTGSIANGAPKSALRPRQQRVVDNPDADLSVQDLLCARRVSFVGANSTTPGLAFGPAGTNKTQTRGQFEIGILF